MQPVACINELINYWRTAQLNYLNVSGCVLFFTNAHTYTDRHVSSLQRTELVGIMLLLPCC